MKGKSLYSRITSALLAICMLLQLVPAITPSAAAADAVTKVIDFKTQPVTGATFAITDATDDMLDALGWSLVQGEGGTSEGVLTHSWTKMYPSIYARLGFTAQNDQAVFKFKLDASGYYDVSSLVWPYKDGMDGEILIDDTFVGTVDFTDKASTEASRAIGRVKLLAGEHTLTVRRANAAGGYLAYIDSITLEPIKEKVINFKTQPITGATFAITDATDAMMDKLGWALVQGEGGTSQGVLTHSWTRMYPSSYARIGFAAKDDQVVFKFKLDAGCYYDVSTIITPYSAGITGEISIDGTPVGEVDFKGETVNGVKRSIGGIELSAGEHKIAVKRTNADAAGYVAYFESITLTPASEPTVVDFRNVLSTDDITLADTDKTFQDHGWKLLRDADSTSASVLGYSMTKIDYQQGTSKLMLEMKSDGEIATIEFNANLEGNYNVKINGWALANAGFDGDVYIDDKLVGRFNCDLPAGETVANFDKEYQVGSVNIDPASTHKLKIVRNDGTVGSGGNNCYAVIKYITFAPADASAYYLPLGSSANGGNTSFTDRDILEHSWVVNDTVAKDMVYSGWSKIYGDYARVNYSTAGAVFAADFKLPYAGNYDLSAAIAPYPGYSIDGDIYIDGEFVGSVDFSAGAENQALKSIALDSGKHTLAVKRTDTRVQEANCTYFKGVNFTPVSALPAVKDVIVKFASSAAMVGETSKVSTGVLMTDGNVYDYYGDKLDGTAGDSIKITNSDDSVASLKDGVMTAQKVGTTTVSVEAVIGGKTYINSADFTVTELPAKTFKLTADTPFAIGVGKTSKVLVQGALSNVITDLSKATEISAKSDNEAIAEAVILHEADRTVVEVTGVTEGETKITVSATVEGIDDTVEIPVTIAKESVKAKPYNVNFCANTAYDILKLSQHGFEVVYDKTSEGVMTDAQTKPYSTSSKFFFPEAGSQLVLKFEAPEDGHYALDFTGYQIGAHGITGAFYIDDTYVGEFNFENLNRLNNNDDTSILTNVHLRDITLEKGVHELTIERINTGTYRHNCIWIVNMMLTPIAQIASPAGIVIDCAKDKLMMGESADTKVSLRMSDGNDYCIPELLEGQGKLSVDAIMPERAKYADGAVTAGSTAGNAVFRITADIVSQALVGYWDIDVADGQLFDFRRDEKTNPDTATIPWDNWAVNTQKSDVDRGSTNYELRNNGFWAVYKHGQVLALDLNVEKTGVYDIDISGAQYREMGAKLDFYMDETYLGTFDFSHPDYSDELTAAEIESLSRNMSAQFNSVELTAGTHTLYLKRTNPGSWRHDTMYLHYLLLTEAKEMPTVSSVAIYAPSQIELNHTAELDVKVWMSNGREYLFGTNRDDGSVDNDNKIVLSVSDKSEDKDAVEIDAQGIVTGKKVGKAIIAADAYVRGSKTTAEHEFSVVRMLKISPAKAVQMERTETAKVELTAILDDTAWDLSKAEYVTVQADYSELIDAEIIIEEGDPGKVFLQVTGLRAGETGLTVNAKLDGVESSAYIPVTVLVPSEATGDLFLDFREGAATSPGGSADAADIITHGWAVNKELTDESSIVNSQWAITGNGIRSEMQYNKKLVLDFMVKKEGYYSVDMVATQYGNFGGVMDFYIDDVYLGRFDFSHPSDDPNQTNNNVWVQMNSLYLSVGKHTATAKRVNDESYRHNAIYWGGFKFTKLENDLSFGQISIEPEKTALVVGESTDINITTFMSDGTVRNFGPLMNGKDDPDNLMSVNITGDKDSVKIENGKLIANAIGTATIEVTSIIDGVTQPTQSVTITVDGENLTTVDTSVAKPVYVNQTVQVQIAAKTGSSRDIDPDCVEITLTTDDTDIISVDGRNITGVAQGPATVKVEAVLNGYKAEDTLEVTVEDDGLVGIIVNAIPRLIRPDSNGTQITVEGGTYLGKKLDLTGAEITYSYDTANGVVTVSETGKVTPTGALGENDEPVTVPVTVTVKIPSLGFEQEGAVNIVVTNGKVDRSIYTDEKVAAARKNIESYDWAKRERDSAVKAADKYVDLAELLWQSVTTQELPRASSVGFRWDTKINCCRYCGVNLADKYGSGTAWIINPLNSPWKIQCPDCRRKFPTNDFASFYKLGIVEKGEENLYGVPTSQWSYEKAHYEHFELFKEDYEKAGVTSYEQYNQMRQNKQRTPAVGYLKNDLYPDVESVPTINAGLGLHTSEDWKHWGVDDGYGYKTGREYSSSDGNMEETHTYIAFYNRQMFATDLIKDAVKNLGLAYVYTGEAKYGRVGAILVDRIADAYPEYKIAPYFPRFPNSDGSAPFGKLDGCIWEYHNAECWARYYDAFFPMYDDPYVINFLSAKAEQYGMENDKSTPELIRENCETNILRGIYKACIDGDIYGNFGLHQGALVVAAISLDHKGETKEMLDYLMAKDESGWHLSDHTGGDVYDKLLNEVDRDGGTSEGLAPNYSALWYNTMGLMAHVLGGYDGYEAADISKNLKYQKMLEASAKLLQVRRGAVAAGDSGYYAGSDLYLPTSARLAKAYLATGNIELAQLAYFVNGNSAKDIREDIFTADPEELEKEIQYVIDTYGEYPFDDSVMMADAGYVALKGGSLYAAGSSSEKDNQRDVWMQFGRYGNHGHPSALNIGMHAYGVDVMPEMGYPTAADAGDEYRNWGLASINHNLVVVNDAKQKELGNPATPLHYEDAGRVKIVDVDAPAAYAETDIYRRTLISVEANDDVAYTVDFFRVKGGNEHLYSFHSQSNDIYSYSGFTPVEYEGTYAGESVVYRKMGEPSGYSYLTNIRKDDNPGTGDISVDFKVTDYRERVKDREGIHMRLTMLNDFDLSEVTFAQGETPVREDNPRWQEFLLARRSGENLDSTFTTVLEPYKGERYIEDMAELSVERTDGEPVNSNGDVVRAIRVDLVGNRSDYIVYASNNSVEYKIDGRFVFQGFAGVLTVKDGKTCYTYLSDGVKFDEVELPASEYTGQIVEFTRNLSFENKITVSFYSENVDLTDLAGRYMYIENDGVSNGAYEIISAKPGENEGTVDLDIGDITLIRSAENVTADSGDYTYNIAPRQWFNIPLSAEHDTSPVFDEVPEGTAASGAKYTVTVNAKSDAESLSYKAASLPRGASFNPETRTVIWVPDDNQIGEHHFAITASDGTLESTVHFIVTVHKSALGSAGAGSGSGNQSGNDTPNVPTPPAGGGGAGGGAGGGGAAGGGETTQPEDTKPEDKPDDTEPKPGEGTGDEGDKFIDLGSHVWAKEAIYYLVDLGVVNGTSANTYSPAANIKRADFAIMLTRAFKISHAEGENFADVDANKYYAEELRLAKIAGIVNGVGNNNFNPEGEITRQHMMLMLYRALVAQGYELSEPDHSVLAEFTDAALISDYAKDAVSVLVKDGIIAGSNGRINPLNKATRAEIAAMLARVIK